MSTHRQVLSADSRMQQQPKRNLAAGKRLAPLPPGLRSRTRGATAGSSTDGTDAGFAGAALYSAHPSSQQPKQRSSSKPRRYDKDGRLHLPPMPPHEQTSQVSTSLSSSTAALASAAHPVSDGHRTAPPADMAHSCRASNSNANTSGAPSAANALGPRASTSEGMRRPSPSKAAPSAASTMPHTVDSGSTHCGAAAAGAATARVERQRPQAPVLSRASADVSGNLCERLTPRSEFMGARTSSSTTALRHSVGASTSASTAATARAVRSSTRVTEPVNRRVATEGVPDDSNPAASTAGEMRGPAEMPELPLAPHDMDVHFYTDESNWCAEEQLPPLVWSLLEGTSLEAPHTSYLWTQAYPQPAELQPPPPVPAATSPSNEGANGQRGELPHRFQHRDSKKRRGGFYACVRCTTPICSPDFQVMPATAALRGIAVFNCLNLKSVDLHVHTAAGDASHTKRPSFKPATSSAISRSGAAKSLSAGDAVLQASSGAVRFVAHCHHCGGCLGAVFIGEIRVPPPTRSPSSPPAETVAQALFCVNSVCLQYMWCRTQAALDGELLGRSSESGPADSEGRGEAAPARRMGVTMGALFGPQRQTAWNLQGKIDGESVAVHASAGAADARSESGSGENFANLLDALNPYSGTDSYDSD
ncbi:hypothetical protein ABL78_7175 [Leptomonas seymouri]|uniref:Uncharacterized protein n=1 Tax=Leptomonas seymouri TaxID=5684 RepID=A0A0N1P9M4_LEPSE|nr:hypothetical protein ABL78_7175 [Leptomonas seymouri]|eukprot:KPI83775.1 hypothetical protein ABL78_7175 [Leptomonas seymouri]